MTQTVKFNHQQFARGVNDVMTLRPLRDALKAAKTSSSGPMGPKRKSATTRSQVLVKNVSKKRKNT